jgi:membrane-bound lytic murein transglycosylase D
MNLYFQSSALTFVALLIFGGVLHARSGETPVVLQEFFGTVDVTKSQDFVPPDYSNQQMRLGYIDGAFAVPPGMEARVAFWLDVYTKYTTDQGVLHDSEYVHLVYETVDFQDIMTNSELSTGQKRKQRQDRVKQAKKAIEERLLRLAKVDSAEGLTDEDLRYWNLFQQMEGGSTKFREAAGRGRLRFQLGQRDRIIEGIYHSGKYIRQMEEIFRQHNLPIELVRMVFVESSFNPKAVSKVGASGVWQFMRYTARQYMRMDPSVDERNDPLTATEAAARKLKSNYQMLQAWPLAITGYNHGPYGVKRVTEKFGTTNIAELTDVRRGRFGFASANFFASFLAALEAERNALKYYGPVKMAPPLVSQTIELTKNVKSQTVIGFFAGNEVLAKEYNLHVRSHLWKGSSIYRGNFIRVPPEKLEMARAALRTEAAAPIPVAGGQYHRVQPGETLSGIALRLGVSQKTLQELNDISDPRSLREGQKLSLPE